MKNTTVIDSRWILVQDGDTGKVSVSYIGAAQTAADPCKAPVDNPKPFVHPFHFSLNNQLVRLYDILPLSDLFLGGESVEGEDYVQFLLNELDTDVLEALWKHNHLYFQQQAYRHIIFRMISRLIDCRDRDEWEAKQLAEVAHD